VRTPVNCPSFGAKFQRSAGIAFARLTNDFSIMVNH